MLALSKGLPAYIVVSGFCRVTPLFLPSSTWIDKISTPKRTAAEVDEELPEVQSQEQAADSRVERLAGRAEGRRAAAEKAEEVVGARPIHITSQLGLVAQRRLRARGWEATWEAAEARWAERAAGEATPPPPGPERGAGGAGRTEAGPQEGLGLGGGVEGGGAGGGVAAEPPQGGEADTGGPPTARVWEEEAETRQMRQREEGVSMRWRRARVVADGARAQARVRREVVRREEEGLRLAEEVSEDRLLVALETLELAEAGQAQRRHVLERKARRTQDERLELKVLRRNAACLGWRGERRRQQRNVC